MFHIAHVSLKLHLSVCKLMVINELNTWIFLLTSQSHLHGRLSWSCVYGLVGPDCLCELVACRSEKAAFIRRTASGLTKVTASHRPASDGLPEVQELLKCTGIWVTTVHTLFDSAPVELSL